MINFGIAKATNLFPLENTQDYSTYHPFFSYPNEIWIDIPEFEGLYQFSNRYRFRGLARVVNCAYGKTRVVQESILKINYSGQYPTIPLWRNNKGKVIRVHILVARIAHANPHNKSTVNHKDGNKMNFRWDNLEWATQSENNKHAFDTGLSKPYYRGGAKNPRAKLSEDDVRKIRELFGMGGITKKALATKFSIDPSCITDIINRKTWVNIL